MFPTATDNDFLVVVDGVGNWSITEWKLPEQKPSNTDVENYWNTNMMDYYKPLKKSELDNQCDLAIMGGFTSSVLGEPHQYQSMVIDEIWFNSTINRFSVDPNFTTVNYKTIDAGYLPHTKEQFFRVFIDGHNYGDSQISKLNGLKAQVEAATTKEELDAIEW